MLYTELCHFQGPATIINLAQILKKYPDSMYVRGIKNRLVNSCIYEKGNYTSQLRQQRHGFCTFHLILMGMPEKKVDPHVFRAS